MGLSTVGLPQGLRHVFLGAKQGANAGFACPMQRCRRRVQESRFVSHDGAGFFSSRWCKNLQEASGSLASSIDRRRRRRLGWQGEVAEAGLFFRTRRFCGKQPIRFTSQKHVYRIVVIVNTVAHLWITRLLFTRSTVYGSHKAVGHACIRPTRKLDKFTRRSEKQLFPHSVPVDMQMLIHSACAASA